MTELTQEMKRDNWDFFVEAKSGDPTHKIPGCENLIENLMASMEITGVDEYSERLERCKVWSDRAHHFYYVEHDIHEAMRHCNAIMRELTIIVYESKSRFATVKSGRFVGADKNV